MNRIDLLHAIQAGAEFQDIGLILLDSTRSNATRPASIKLAATDKLVKGLRGDMQRRPAVFLVIIPPELKARMDSPIIQPGDPRANVAMPPAPGVGR